MKASRFVRFLLALFVLAVSLALLAWGLLPSIRQHSVRRIQPGELQLPTPGAVVPAPEGWSLS